MFSNRRQLRLLAARVLLVWLFGFAAGLANACWAATLLDLGLQPLRLVASQHEVPVGDAMPECALHSGVHQASAEGVPVHQDDAATAGCQAFCDHLNLSISQAKSTIDDPGAHALPPPAIAISPNAADFSPVHRLTPRRDDGLAPPITIAFLRLAL